AADEAAAQGALVYSSWGAPATTDNRGSYRLELSLPDGAERVQIGARANGNWSAEATVDLSVPGGPPVVLPLVVARRPCTPRWIPTFGAQPGTAGNPSPFLPSYPGTARA